MVQIRGSTVTSNAGVGRSTTGTRRANVSGFGVSDDVGQSEFSVTPA
jgi:hypothetical protein